MDIKEVQISEIKNLNLIYIFTTDSILKDKSKSYIGARVVFDDNRTLSMDYKDPHFEYFIRKLIERYNKEKDNRNIILLGNLTKSIIQDETYESIGTIPTDNIVGLSLFDTKNFELKKYQSYFFDTLKNILKTTKCYETIDIDKIDGYNHKFIVYYHVGSVNLQMNIIVSFRDKNHIDFFIGYVDDMNLQIKGTIENNINYVNINWSSSKMSLYGENTYDTVNNLVEKKIVSDEQTIYHSEKSDTIIEEDYNLINFYLKMFGISVPKNIIKTLDYNYILGDEEIINYVDTEVFYKNNGVQLSINNDSAIIRYQVINGLSKYNNKINVTLSKSLVEITLTKLEVDRDNYVLIEQKDTNDFGTTYKYKAYKVDDIDFTKPFTFKNEINVDTEVNSLHDVKRYIKINRRENS